MEMVGGFYRVLSMSTSSRSPLVPLSASELAALASASQLASPAWDQVTISFEGRPEVLAELRALAASVPAATLTRDPFVNALRRICWPDERVSLPHRQALATVGEPFGMLRLVAEEARTAALRHLSVGVLEPFWDFFEAGPDNIADPVLLQIANRLYSARLFVAILTGLLFAEPSHTAVVEEMREALADDSGPKRRRRKGSSKASSPPQIKTEIEALCGAFLLISAFSGDDEEPIDIESQEFPGLNGEGAVLLEFTKAFVYGFLNKDIDRGQVHLFQALANIDDEVDPWLELLVRLTTAWAVELKVDKLVPVMTSRLRSKVSPGMTMTPLSHPFLEIFLEYRAELSLEWEMLKPGLDHLMAAEKLLREFATPRMLTEYFLLRAKMVLLKDVARATADMIDAVLAARQLGDQGRMARQLEFEALMYKSGLVHLGSEIPGATEVVDRFVVEVAPNLMESWDAIQARKKKSPASKKKATTRRKPPKRRK